MSQSLTSGLSSERERHEVDLAVKEIMTPSPLTLDVNATITQAAKGMERCGCGCCLVESRGKIVGIVTERDIVRRAAAKNSSLRKTKVRKIMSSPIVAVNPETTVEESLKVMAASGIRRLVVVQDGGLIGIVSITDVAKALAKKAGYANSLLKALAREGSPPSGIYV